MKEKSECRYGARNELLCGVVLLCLQYSDRAETDVKDFTKKCECFVEKRAHSLPFGRDAHCEQISVRSGSSLAAKRQWSTARELQGVQKAHNRF